MDSRKVVTKIGRKYITVADDLEMQYREEKFDVNRFLHYYTVGGRNYELFLTREDILTDIECEEVYTQIKNSFSAYKNERKYSIEQRKQIIGILR